MQLLEGDAEGGHVGRQVSHAGEVVAKHQPVRVYSERNVVGLKGGKHTPFCFARGALFDKVNSQTTVVL